jgi:hypothetical protein
MKILAFVFVLFVAIAPNTPAAFTKGRGLHRLLSNSNPVITSGIPKFPRLGRW